ncbi:UNVERIFIED_CONTAM: Arrestin domain-containing protein 4, partial [Gekko kuhli]
MAAPPPAVWSSSPSPVRALALALCEPAGGAYGAGETVSGQVALELAAPLTFRALRLEAAGRARAAWSEGGASVAAADAAAGLEAEVPYLDVRQDLLGRGGEEGLILLEAGKHEFPFSFQLPQQPLATSFNGKYGSIQYCVRATLERPVAPSQTVKREFQVVNHIDVNSPALLSPVIRNQEKMVGCWFFTSGPVSLSAKIERKGYCN